MTTLKAWDTINGALGTCYAIIDGQKEEMLYLKNIQAQIKKNKREIKVLGQTGSKHKASGWSGSGKMTIYYSTTKFRELLIDYIKNGKDSYFEIIIENDDPSSEIGRQTIAIKQVNIDAILMAKLDINNTELDEEITFTFNDIDILNSFSPVVGE
ncbi:MAG: phage tail tube protein [bacterium]